MKSPLLLLTFCLVAGLAFSQTEKGKLLVGATTSNASFGVGAGGTRVLNVNLNPRVGYFLANNLVAGVELGIGYGSMRQNGQNVSRSGSLNSSLFGRYYFLSGKHLRIPVEVNVGAGGYWVRNTSFEDARSQFSVGGMGGLALFPNESMSIDLLAGYARSSVLGAVFGSSGRLLGVIGFSLYLDPRKGETSSH